MPLELLLQQETKGLTEDELKEVIRYIRFIKIESGISARHSKSTNTSTGKRKIRSAGKYRGQGWMSDDFDEPLDVFKEYM